MSEERKMAADEKKRKKSKLDKIYEMQAANKELKEENRSLRKQLEAQKHGQSPRSTTSGGKHVGTSRGGGSSQWGNDNDDEKLLQAMKTLKRVTVNQEKTLSSYRKKAEQRRQEIEERDKTIGSLKNEVAKLERSRKTSKDTNNDDSLDPLRAKVEDLQVMCSDYEARNMELEEQAKRLQTQLDSARSLLHGGVGSTRSMRSGDTSLSEADVARLKKDLAKKIERIVLLEFDLEMCKDELHELRQGQRMSPGGFASNSDAQETTDLESSFYSETDEEGDEDN
jgi:cell division septum initiation protein DivIVA